MTVTLFYKDNIKQPHIFEYVLNVKETEHFYVMRLRDGTTKHLVDIKIPLDNIYSVREYRDGYD